MPVPLWLVHAGRAGRSTAGFEVKRRREERRETSAPSEGKRRKEDGIKEQGEVKEGRWILTSVYHMVSYGLLSLMKILDAADHQTERLTITKTVLAWDAIRARRRLIRRIQCQNVCTNIEYRFAPPCAHCSIPSLFLVRSGCECAFGRRMVGAEAAGLRAFFASLPPSSRTTPPAAAHTNGRA